LRRQLSVSLIFVSLILVACTGGVTPEASAKPTPLIDSTAPTETTTPIFIETPTILPTATIQPRRGFSGAYYDGMTLSMDDCNYEGYIQSVEATTPIIVTFTLCKPDPAFLYKLALNSIAIYPREWIEATSGAESRTPEGLDKPIGTGPYMVEEWKHGESLTLVKNPKYWGHVPSPANTLIFRWSPESAQRMLALQSGIADGIDRVAPNEIDTIQPDPNLQLAVRPGLNVFYIGMTNIFPPFNYLDIRKAIAMSIDRLHIVDTFFPEGSELASHFTPCSIQYGCLGETWYAFDPVTARNLLAETDYADGFKTKLFYRDVERDFQPQVGNIALDIQAQLKKNLNIEVDLVPMESNAFIKDLSAGRLEGLYLHGLSATYPHITNFLDNRFSRQSQQFGNPFPEIYENLTAGAQSDIPVDTEKYYLNANNAILKYVPMIPIAHAGFTVAYRADTRNPQVSPLGYDFFAYSIPDNRNTFTWMQTSEPKSLFCADETDVDTLRACAQIMEGLYSYEPNGTSIKPVLATDCTPNAEWTVWVCTLRQGVKFHDGSDFDPTDVVATFDMALNPGSPNHKGNTNAWDTYGHLWGLMWK